MEGLGVTQTEVIRVMAVVMEKRGPPQEPQGSHPQEAAAPLGENPEHGASACCILGPRCSPSVSLFSSFGSEQAPLPQERLAQAIRSEWVVPLFLPITPPL